MVHRLHRPQQPATAAAGLCLEAPDRHTRLLLSLLQCVQPVSHDTGLATPALEAAKAGVLRPLPWFTGCTGRSSLAPQPVIRSCCSSVVAACAALGTCWFPPNACPRGLQGRHLKGTAAFHRLRRPQQTAPSAAGPRPQAPACDVHMLMGLLLWHVQPAECDDGLQTPT